MGNHLSGNGPGRVREGRSIARESAGPAASHDCGSAGTRSERRSVRERTDVISGQRSEDEQDHATDGTDRLRYLVGDDSRGFIRVRQEMADQDDVAFLEGYMKGVGSVVFS